MLRFLLFFLSIYSAMHALFFLRVHVLLPERRSAQWGFALFLFLMILAPILCRLMERAGHDLAARITATVGYVWMGFIFVSFWFCLLMTLYDALAWTGARLLPHAPPLLTGKTPVLAMLAATLLLCGYGAFEAGRIRTERVTLTTTKLPAHVPRLTIAQITDVHLGMMARSGRLKTILEKVDTLDPDILVSTGDLVDGSLDHLPELLELLQAVRPRYGKFAVTGNHEVYSGLSKAVAFTREAGFTVLRNSTSDRETPINIVGVDDAPVNLPEREVPLLRIARNGKFTLYLKHRPLVCPETTGLFDLQLSGHTHAGQMFPFNFVVALQYPLLKGRFSLENGSTLYTSRGTGFWGPPMRLLAPPEITLIELVRGSS